MSNEDDQSPGDSQWRGSEQDHQTIENAQHFLGERTYGRTRSSLNSGNTAPATSDHPDPSQETEPPTEAPHGRRRQRARDTSNADNDAAAAEPAGRNNTTSRRRQPRTASNVDNDAADANNNDTAEAASASNANHDAAEVASTSNANNNDTAEAAGRHTTSRRRQPRTASNVDNDAADANNNDTAEVAPPLNAGHNDASEEVGRNNTTRQRRQPRTASNVDDLGASRGTGDTSSRAASNADHDAAGAAARNTTSAQETDRSAEPPSGRHRLARAASDVEDTDEAAIRNEPSAGEAERPTEAPTGQRQQLARATSNADHQTIRQTRQTAASNANIARPAAPSRSAQQPRSQAASRPPPEDVHMHGLGSHTTTEPSERGDAHAETESGHDPYVAETEFEIDDGPGTGDSPGGTEEVDEVDEFETDDGPGTGPVISGFRLVERRGRFFIRDFICPHSDRPVTIRLEGCPPARQGYVAVSAPRRSRNAPARPAYLFRKAALGLTGTLPLLEQMTEQQFFQLCVRGVPNIVMVTHYTVLPADHRPEDHRQVEAEISNPQAYGLTYVKLKTTFEKQWVSRTVFLKCGTQEDIDSHFRAVGVTPPEKPKPRSERASLQADGARFRSRTPSAPPR